MSRIGIILELNSTYFAALSAAEKYPDGTIEIIKVNNYSEGIAAARRLTDSGTEILISRAGYIPKLRAANIKIPLIEIPFSISNLVYELVKAQQQYGSVGLTGTKSLLDAAREIECALESKIKYYEVTSVEDYRSVAEQAKNDGIRVLVGGYDETRFAENAGLSKIILNTSTDEILVALCEAQKIIDQIDIKNKQSEELNMIFNIIEEGLIMFDFSGSVTLMNQTASSIFSDGSLSDKSDSKCFPWVEQINISMRNDEALLNSLQEYKGTKYITSIYPVHNGGLVSGAVMKLQRVKDVQGMEQSIRSQLFKKGLVAKYTFDNIIGRSSKIKETILMAKRYSGVDSTVLITGESGTGKELFAQSIHNLSPRSNGPFVAINCAAIPSALLESELFGYKEGAFTGARKGGKAGLFELAHNGTLFLDEIGEIDISIQARLLRVLEERRIMRLGDDSIIPVNVRIIAATNKNLNEMVKRGQFREDFFYRLNVLAIELPPLRERRSDIELLINHFIVRECSKMHRPSIQILPDGMRILTAYDWPGNIRELTNIIERLVVISPREKVDSKIVEDAMGVSLAKCTKTKSVNTEELLEKESRLLIQKTLNDCNGNKSAAAARLGISRPTLYRKLKKMNFQE